MNSARNVEYTRRAGIDIRDILRYTRRTWGEHQRDVYADKLIEGFETLAHFPELGHSRQELSPGIYSRRIEHYVVYYRFTAETLTVVRLRHVKSDTLRSSDF